MKLHTVLNNAISRLEGAGIGTARLDSLLIMERVMGVDRSKLLASLEMEVSDDLNTKITQYLVRRSAHEPLAYIFGTIEFYGRKFKVDSSVLVPRPESETMIDMLKHTVADNSRKMLVVDIGTGSGALAITAQLELPSLEVVATDIDPKCLKIARQNIKTHGLGIQCFESNLLQSLPPALKSGEWGILANLPYVPDNHTVNQAAATEPKLAIFGGPDGLNVYRDLFRQIGHLPVQPSFILTEALPFQYPTLAKIAMRSGYQAVRSDDFIQLFVPSEIKLPAKPQA